MQVKGSLTVKSILTAGRRVNEGLNTTFIEQTTELDKHSSKNQYIRINTEQTLVLPDATTLPTGWGVNVYSSDESFAKLTINDHDGNRIYNLAPKKSVTLILLEKATTAGVWRVVRSGAGGGLGDGNVPLYSEGSIFQASDTAVEKFTVYADWDDGSESCTDALYYVLATTRTIAGGQVLYIWTSSRSDIPLYTLTDRTHNFTVYGDEQCTSTADIITHTHQGEPDDIIKTLKVSGATITSTILLGGVDVRPFVANVMNGIDEGGDVESETIFFSGGTAISAPETYPVTKYIYISIDGVILEEKARQRGGNMWPLEPVDGDIFFFKPLRRNYKYISGEGWTDYPCTAIGELTFVSEGRTIVREYPKNEWWWDYKYGDERNTVIVSSGTVLSMPSVEGIPVGTDIQGVKVGNVVATVADGYTPEGLPVDFYATLPYQVEVPYQVGTASYYYILKDGAIETSPNKPAGGDELPVLDAETDYTDGVMFFSKKDGKNFKLVGGAWEEYPAVCVAYISALGTPRVYPFNSPAWGEAVVPHNQIFLNASAPTTEVTVDEKILDQGHMTVNVCNTVLQSDTYFLQADHMTIKFTNAIEPGLRIEVRWYTPLNVTHVSKAQVSTVSVDNFDNFDSLTLYSVVHTTQNVTLNAPLNVTADWLVLCIDANDVRFMRASRLDDPSATLYRTRGANGVWTDWMFSYATYWNG